MVVYVVQRGESLYSIAWRGVLEFDAAIPSKLGVAQFFI